MGIRKTRFFALLNQYHRNPSGFSIKYNRKTSTRIPQSIETNIIKELKIDKELIENINVPLKSYNYSYIKNRLEQRHKQKVSLPTIINRAKLNNFYLKTKHKKSLHDREVLTNFTGELIQHDSSHHLWSPAAKEKWYLITSIDDFSRFILYAKLLEKETSWAHITALQDVVLKYGIPYSYYVDSHSVFRFVQKRDSLWRIHHKLTDEVDPQWKQVTSDCNINVIYALSPQAKGKAERPYGWLQDRLVRTCVRENITKINQAQQILDQELNRYNYYQVHSTTKEVPHQRFQGAMLTKQTLFREFKLIPPFQSVKDVFCLRFNRTIDSYRKISINNLQIKVNNATPGKLVTLRIYPMDDNLSEVRFWCNNTIIDVQKLKTSDILTVHF